MIKYRDGGVLTPFYQIEVQNLSPWLVELCMTAGTVQKFTSSYPQTNGMVERLNHSLCQMLSYLIADDQKKWDEMLMHAVAAHNNNVISGTGRAPNEVLLRIGRYPRLPITILEARGVNSHQGLK